MLDPGSSLTYVQADLIYTYMVSRGSGRPKHTAAQITWKHAKCKYYKHLRAPNWYEQIAHNSGCKRSYSCPLGRILGITTGEYGSHSARYPRTKRSLEAMSNVANEVLEYLESFVELGANGNFDHINEAYDHK